MLLLAPRYAAQSSKQCGAVGQLGQLGQLQVWELCGIAIR